MKLEDKVVMTMKMRMKKLKENLDLLEIERKEKVVTEVPLEALVKLL